MNKSNTNAIELDKYLNRVRRIPAGKFVMGSVKGDSDERPVRRIRVNAFQLGMTPVTVGMWQEYCLACGLDLPPKPRWGYLRDHPVVNVSWNDIMGADGNGGFCAWASDVTGHRWTLPTEAQWEYAARGGLQGMEYPWGDLPDKRQIHWFQSSRNKIYTTMPVTRKSGIQRGGYGLVDMVGNVWQWCLNPYQPYATKRESPSPTSITTKIKRCVRGGSGPYYPGEYRCADRAAEFPETVYNDLGFRCVVNRM